MTQQIKIIEAGNPGTIHDLNKESGKLIKTSFQEGTEAFDIEHLKTQVFTHTTECAVFFGCRSVLSKVTLNGEQSPNGLVSIDAAVTDWTETIQRLEAEHGEKEIINSAKEKLRGELQAEVTELEGKTSTRTKEEIEQDVSDQVDNKLPKEFKKAKGVIVGVVVAITAAIIIAAIAISIIGFVGVAIPVGSAIAAFVVTVIVGTIATGAADKRTRKKIDEAQKTGNQEIAEVTLLNDKKGILAQEEEEASTIEGECDAINTFLETSRGNLGILNAVMENANGSKVFISSEEVESENIYEHCLQSLDLQDGITVNPNLHITLEGQAATAPAPAGSPEQARAPSPENARAQSPENARAQSPEPAGSRSPSPENARAQSPEQARAPSPENAPAPAPARAQSPEQARAPSPGNAPEPAPAGSRSPSPEPARSPSPAGSPEQARSPSPAGSPEQARSPSPDLETDSGFESGSDESPQRPVVMNAVVAEARANKEQTEADEATARLQQLQQLNAIAAERQEQLAAQVEQQSRVAAVEAEQAKVAAEEAELARAAEQEAEAKVAAEQEAEQAKVAAEEAELARVAEEAEKVRAAEKEAEKVRLEAIANKEEQEATAATIKLQELQKLTQQAAINAKKEQDEAAAAEMDLTEHVEGGTQSDSDDLPDLSNSLDAIDSAEDE